MSPIGSWPKHRIVVIAHRGASGERPEHTLAAYQLAIEQGADFIEPDLVVTRDGVLIARHENELSGTTDVADHAGFADRKVTKRIDGVDVEGWFSEDFTLAEIKQLRARERIPDVRPQNVAHDGRYEIPTFAEVIRLAAAANRPVGVYPETKHPTFFRHEGRRADGQVIGVSLGQLLVRTLVTERFTDPARVFIQSFEVANLRELKHDIMPAEDVSFPLIQLIGDADSQPYDLAFHRRRGDRLEALYGPLASPWALANGLESSYESLVGKDVLPIVRDDYAAGLGPAKSHVLSVTGLPPRLTGETAAFVAHARRLGLHVHAYTLRAEEQFIPLGREGQRRTYAEELKALAEAGVNGVFTDHPRLAAPS